MTDVSLCNKTNEVSESNICIEQLAALSNLRLTQDEQKLFSESLQKIMKVLDDLSSVNTDGVEPFAFAPVEIQDLCMNHDTSCLTEDLNAWLRQQPFTKDGYICVPHFQQHD